jgi:hypothetical protein
MSKQPADKLKQVYTQPQLQVYGNLQEIAGTVDLGTSPFIDNQGGNFRTH